MTSPPNGSSYTVGSVVPLRATAVATSGNYPDSAYFNITWSIGGVSSSASTTGATSDGGATWTASWNTFGYPNQITYTITAVGVKSGYGTGISLANTVSLKPAASQSNVLIVTLLTPIYGQALQGTALFSAQTFPEADAVTFRYGANAANMSNAAQGTLADNVWGAFWDTTSIPNGTYYVDVRAERKGSPMTQSVPTPVTIDNPPDTKAPTLLNIEPLDLTSTSVRITWNTDEDADSRVDYGWSEPYDHFAFDGSLTKSHAVSLTGLTSNRLYRYRVTSKDAAGNSETSVEFPLLTLPTPSAPAADSTATGTYTPEAALEATPSIDVDKGLQPLEQPPENQLCVPSGRPIKTAASSAVYYCGTDDKRYVFPNEKIYFSWFPEFSAIATITDAEMAAIPIGGNVTYRPGARMIKIMSDPRVYAVSRGGLLRWVTTEAVAAALYGPYWNQQIDDVSDALFVNYTIGEPIESTP